MHTASNVFAAALAASVIFSSAFVEAAPRGRDGDHDVRVLGGETYRLRQWHNEKYKRDANTGPLKLAKTYNKFNAPLPDSLANAIAGIIAGMGINSNAGNTSTTVTGSVSAIPQAFDREYLSPVQIGTPPQTVNLDFDTGSADLWVFSSSTPDVQTNGQLEYNPPASSTANILPGATWDITYGDGSSSSGEVFHDVVTIGGITVQKQAVESASQVSTSFQNDIASSGLLGLSFSKLNTVRPVQEKTFFDNAIDTLAQPLFTVNLKKQEAGNYNFGYINASEYTGEIAYTPLDAARGFWGFNTSGFQVGNTDFKAEPWFAIADTGTSLLLMPDDIVAAYWSAVPGATFDSSQGGITFPCTATLPDFTFGIGEYRGVVPGPFMLYANINTDLCFGGIQSSTGIGFSIFGDVVLKAQFVVFDGGNERLGWANKDLTAALQSATNA